MIPREDPRKSPLHYEKELLFFLSQAFSRGKTPLVDQVGKRAVWSDTATRIHKMMSRSVLAFLIYRGGWEKKYSTTTNEKLRRDRLWERPDLKNLKMRFDAQSVIFCMDFFDCVRKHDSESIPLLVESLRKIKSPSGNLAALILCKSLLSSSKYDEIAGSLALGSPYASILFAHKREDLNALNNFSCFFREWGWSFPWIGDSLISAWAAIDEAKMSKDISHFRASVNWLTASMRPVLDSAIEEEQLERLIPIMAFFKERYAEIDCESVNARLEDLMSGMRITDKQDIRDEWGGMLRVLTEIHTEQKRIWASHPVDRTGNERAFASEWTDREMGEIAGNVEGLRVLVENVVSSRVIRP